ncbi:ABC transporter substrate-binding protein [Candidatus Palauibacter soopunensis]|uniref:ABC transporter substrate-binding protein n=1 Tax=Candidatus Palauibacter soopunensis TaxID=3056739 RepID=UPI0023A66273|nr:ABC transporter substrate-binding protein [Candidatus Palauibacter soopunensis]MDE2878910.1 ABC transporter substrate-binding protein [Candidatus Palauibacter soopunensis]
MGTDPLARAAARTSASAAALVACFAAHATAQSITAVSYGGSYQKASTEAWFEPFTDASGIRVDVEDFTGGLAQIRAQVEVGNVYWDVVDLNVSDVTLACDEGLLEYIDAEMLPPGADGTAAAEDFVPGTLSDCGVGVVVWSTIYAFDASRYPDAAPATIADFFDLEKFPGRRGMRRVPMFNLEFALLADGVPVEEVYALLDTPEGLDRAFRKLDTIKDHVVWWEAGAQPPQMLADGEVVMSTAYNGRIFNAQVLENQPFVIVWDGQLLDINQLAIVAGTPRVEEAMRLASFASTAEALAALGRRISYGPARASAAPLITTHLETGVEMGPHLPTHPSNMARALWRDWAWWVDNQDVLNERFSAWLAR